MATATATATVPVPATAVKMVVPSPPPPVTNLAYGTLLVAGRSTSTVLADLDFETYSEAGYVWDEADNVWKSPVPGKEAGLGLVGAQVYAEHPSTEILSMSYNLKDGAGARVWLPGMPFPRDLLGHILAGRLVAAWNVGFEDKIWRHVGQKKYGFPPFPVRQWRCDMAKSRAFCLPGKLEKCGAVLGLNEGDGKLKDGKRIVKRYCCPHKPSGKDPRRRIHPLADGAAGLDLYRYNQRDIHAEAVIAAKIPDLSESELAYWLVDQECNRRGVRMDVETIDAMLYILDHVYANANARVQELTGGTVSAPSEVAKLLAFLAARGVHLSALDEEATTEALTRDLDPVSRELLQIRQDTSAASVKKAYTMKRMLSQQGRLHDLFIYHSARTGRDAGADAQPQNLPSSGPDVSLCMCGQYFSGVFCPACYTPAAHAQKAEWCYAAVEQTLPLIKSGNIAGLSRTFGSPVAAISGCMRALFIADEGCDFIATDYSSIEAVVAAALSGEQWRLSAFAAKECIYLASVSKIKGIPVEEYKKYKAETKLHHPDRKIGKVAELASGFGGWVGAWRAFGADKVLGDEQAIKKAIIAWQQASPAIVEMWGGQFRGKPWLDSYRPELYGLEGCAIQALMYPGQTFSYRGIEYVMQGAALYCKLLSGRYITYHNARLGKHPTRDGMQITFEGWNTNPKAGPFGWIRMDTYGGKLFENVVQATARDILAHAAVNCEQRGYAVILRVHDELVTQVPEGTGSVEELEAICGELPEWAKGWPVRAAGGWRGKRYRKD